MEDDYNKNESLVVRVMRQVDALKMWRFKNDKTGFASEYAEVLRCVEELDDSNEKEQHACGHTFARILVASGRAE